MRKLILPIVLCIGLSVSLFGQVKEITYEESVGHLIEGYEKYDQTSWRKNEKTEYFKDGKLVRTIEKLEEFLQPDRSRIVKTSTEGGSVGRSELLKIGEIFFCRENNRAWVRSEEWWCGKPEGFVGSKGVENSSKYTVEDTKAEDQKAKVYRHYVVYQNDAGETFWDYRFWINDAGFIIRREIETGIVKTRAITSRMVETSHYTPADLRIEPPIIDEKPKS